jgi:cytochrome c-type biogenesis protein CcmH/NrfG
MEGQKLATEGKTEQSRAAYRTAYETYPTLSYAAAMHGQVVYETERNLELAEKILSDTLLEAPMFPAVHFLLAQLYLEQQQIGRGKQHLDTLLKIPRPEPPQLREMANRLLQTVRAHEMQPSQQGGATPRGNGRGSKRSGKGRGRGSAGERRTAYANVQPNGKTAPYGLDPAGGNSE